MSAEPTDDYCVRLFHEPSASQPGFVSIGFTTSAAFDCETDITWKDGVYTLWPWGGTLFGSGKEGEEFYCEVFSDATIRCVADRDRRTITFHVNGVDRGVAWTNVTASPLYAVVVFYYPGIVVELLE